MQDLVSIGNLAENLQRSPRVIERALSELEIEPVLSLNELCYFDSASINALRGYFYNLERV